MLLLSATDQAKSRSGLGREGSAGCRLTNSSIGGNRQLVMAVMLRAATSRVAS